MAHAMFMLRHVAKLPQLRTKLCGNRPVTSTNLRLATIMFWNVSKQFVNATFKFKYYSMHN